MGEPKFTPGRWRADDHGLVYQDADGQKMLGSFNMMRPGGGNPMELRANGILAAAAPDLYAAADEAHAFMSIVMPTSKTAEAHAIVARLRAALNKALGDPSHQDDDGRKR